MTLSVLHLLADYNQWMNTRLYDAASPLNPQALTQDRGAFFGSILGTLNHLLVADTLWLQRFAGHPALQARMRSGRLPELNAVCQWPSPQALDEPMCIDLALGRSRRQQLDQAILATVHALTEADLDHALQYLNMKRTPQRKPMGHLMLHFFNHQTHHRGQVTTLLTQAGVEVGSTDLTQTHTSQPTPCHRIE
jgi:uncharacterized damage-inducible protein DinB